MTGLMDRVARLEERMDELDNTDRLLDEARAARIAALEAVLAERTRERDDERKRREDAEALLREVRTSTIDQLDFEIAPLIDAHFARYGKD